VIKFEKIVAPMTLYDVRKARWPSPNRYSVWPVLVKEIDPVKRTALVSWNGNTPTWVSERSVTQYRATRPKEKR